MMSTPTFSLWRKHLLLAFLLQTPLVTQASAHNDEPGEIREATAEFMGSWRTSYWSRSRSLDNEQDILATALWAQGRATLGGLGSVHVDGWIRKENRTQPDYQPQRYGYARLREAYVSLRSSDMDFTLGRQIIMWGRADIFNPTDVLSPRDYTLLTPEDTDQRSGALAASFKYQAGNTSISMFLLPRFRSDTLPIPPEQGLLYAFSPPPRRNQYALRLDTAEDDMEWSFSYFDGYDRVPDFSVAGVVSGRPVIGITNHRVRILGADFSTGVGNWVIRGEMAMSKPKSDQSNNLGRKNPQIFGIAGLERGLGNGLTFNLQYFRQHVSHFQPVATISDPFTQAVRVRQLAIANQTRADQHGVTLRLMKRLFNDTLEIEALYVNFLSQNAHASRFKIHYAIDDDWRLSAGIDRFHGAITTYPGQFRDNSGGYIELRRSF